MNAYPDDDPLSWLSSILWPDETVHIVRRSSSETGDGPSWWAYPSLDRPRILIPADLGPAARTAVARYHDGMSFGLRARSLAAEVLALSGPLARLALRSNRVAPTATGGSIGSHPAPTEDLLSDLADITGVADLRFAIGMSVPKSNRKPVIQLLAADGRCLGWAKVGWNGWTDRLVGNEAAWLMRPRAGSIGVPDLLHDRRVAGRRVVVTGTVPVTRRPGRAVDRPPPPEVFASVAGMGTADEMPLERTPWWRSVERYLPWADDRERAAVESAADMAADLADPALAVGGFHGDLTPWNLSTGPDRLYLIDWEFAADGVPVGFDLCHFHTQVGAELRGLDAAAALDRSARLSPAGLAALGLRPDHRRVVWHLYLVELIRRTLALRSDGHPTAKITFGPAAARRLQRTVRPRPGGHAGPAEHPRRRATDRPDPTPGWSSTEPAGYRHGDTGTGLAPVGAPPHFQKEDD